MINSLNELKEKNVIISYEREEKKEGRKIVDMKYNVIAHPNFIAEQKVANKRKKIQIIEAQKTGLIVEK